METEIITRNEMYMPSWLKLNSRWDPRNGGFYSSDPLTSCPETLRGISKHSNGKGEFTDPYSEAADPQWRSENLTMAGVAKHAGFGHPVGMVLGFDSSNTVYSQARSDTWGTPLGYSNHPSQVLKASIEHLRSGQEPESWNELAPLRMLDDNHPNTYMWTTNVYEPAMAAKTSARGPGNVVEAQMQTGVGKLEIHKSTARIFINFAATEMGTAHFHHSLIVMANGFVLAGQYAAAVKLASADLEYEERVRLDGGFLPTVDGYWNAVAEFWAYFQRPHHNNIAAMRTMFDNKLLLQGAEPSSNYCWLITKATCDCITKFDEHSLDAHLAGDRAIDRLESKVVRKMRIGGDDVFVMNPFVFPRRVLSQPFGQPVEIAEHFEMFDENQDGNVKTRDRAIFDHEKGFVKITFEHALTNLCCWKKSDGSFIPANSMEAICDDPKSYFPYSGPDGKTAPTTTEMIKSVTGDKTNAVTTGTFSRDAYVTAHKAGGKTPFGIIGIQAHQRYYTENSYYLLPGKVVERVQKSGDAVIVDKAPEFIHEVTAEVLLGAATVGAQNIVRAPNTTITGYAGGCGTKPIDLSKYDPTEEKYGDGDIIYIMVPYETKITDLPHNINLHGDVTKLSQYYAPPADPKANWYPGCSYVNTITKWRLRKTGDPTMRYYQRENRTVPYPVAFVSRRMTYYLADANGNMKYLRPGNGFWGLEGTYHTATRVRVGKSFADHPERGTEYTMIDG
jgi:hypothetical protein